VHTCRARVAIAMVVRFALACSRRRGTCFYLIISAHTHTPASYRLPRLKERERETSLYHLNKREQRGARPSGSHCSARPAAKCGPKSAPTRGHCTPRTWQAQNGNWGCSRHPPKINFLIFGLLINFLLVKSA
jgi:hypothetical protein